VTWKLDARLTNATVLTMDTRHPVATTVGIWNGLVVGVDDAVTELPARQEVDLGGATVVPGFIDAHVHLAWAGTGMRSVSIGSCERIEDVLRVIAKAAGERGQDEWLDVVGYDQRPLGRHLTVDELDAAGGGRKVFVVHDSGHACVVSSAVLRMLPVDVEHHQGVLAESGMAAVRELRQPYALDELVDAIEAAGRQCLAEGITTVAEAGIGGGLISHSGVELDAYQRAQEQGRLPLRVQLMIAADALHEVAAHPADGVTRALDLGLRTGFGGDRLSIGPLKIWTDGGMMPRTAALTEPYVGLDHSGQFYRDPDVLVQQMVDGHRAGWQLAVHAIGDRAVDLALAGLERAQAEHPRAAARHRIEHAGLVRPDQLPRLAALGAAAVVQPNFLTYLGDDYAAVMGESRAPWLYRGKAFLDAGVPLVGSSDRPVTDGAPLRAMQFMVERRTAAGLTVGPDESITVLDALQAYTATAAWACRAEDRIGSISPGKRADLVVLDADPRAVDTARLGELRVRATLLDGRVAHGDSLGL
jgi:hypothetical protein